jgi:hypothetical protein
LPALQFHHPPRKIFPPIAATKFITDRTKFLYLQKKKAFKKTAIRFFEEPNKNQENPLPKVFYRRFALPMVG